MLLWERSWTSDLPYGPLFHEKRVAIVWNLIEGVGMRAPARINGVGDQDWIAELVEMYHENPEGRRNADRDAKPHIH